MPERSRRLVAFVLLGLVTALTLGVVGTALPAAAQGDAAEPVHADGPVRFVAGEGVELLVDGERRYLDTLELRPSGPTMVNELGIESYVAGVAEMPSRWAADALKAQAVAARTYAWYSIGLGSFEGYDICATTACQVFRGAEVVRDGGERWAAAVEQTAGEVLVAEPGAPILARYFSTSGGRTFANEEVFPSSGPRDYLVAIDDPDDEVSPYHRWTVRFTRAEFDDILSRGERLAATVPVGAIERLGDVRDQGAELRVTGQDGTQIDLGADELRDFISRVAPERHPDRFPSMRDDGLRPLPSTIPSSRYEVEVGDDEVVVRGQGWGHGVGMGQYGARGRAERGEDYRDILAAYYGGLTPTADPALPERIRVGITVGDEVTIRADGPARIEATDGTTIQERALGTWTAQREDGGWRLDPPTGTATELEVSTTRTVELAAILDAVTLEADVNKPALLHLEVRADPGSDAVAEPDADADADDDVPVLARELGVGDPGTHTATWRFVDDQGDPVPPGDYLVTIVAEDAGGARAGTPTTVTVTEDAAEAAAEARERRESDSSGTLTIVLVAAIALPVAAVLALVVGVLATRKARS